MNKDLTVKCPNCDEVFPYYESKFRPFCSERCKMIDLGHWFEETYRVPLKQNNQAPGNDFESDQEEYEENKEISDIEDEEYQ